MRKYGINNYTFKKNLRSAMAIDGETWREMNVLPESHLAPLYLKMVTNAEYLVENLPKQTWFFNQLRQKLTALCSHCLGSSPNIHSPLYCLTTPNDCCQVHYVQTKLKTWNKNLSQMITVVQIVIHSLLSTRIILHMMMLNKFFFSLVPCGLKFSRH